MITPIVIKYCRNRKWNHPEYMAAFPMITMDAGLCCPNDPKESSSAEAFLAPQIIPTNTPPAKCVSSATTNVFLV